MADAAEVLFSTPNFRDVLQAIGSLDSALEKLSKSGQAAGDRAAKASAKSAGDATKAIAREAAEAKRAQEREAREAIRIKNAINNLEVRDWQQKEREKTRAAEEEGRKQTAAAKRAASEASQAHEKQVREMEARAKRFGSTAGNATTRALGTVGRVATMAATLGGGFGIADSLGKGIQREATAGIIFRGAAQKGEFENQKQVQDLASSTAIATGGTTEDILGGLDMFVRKTGDLGAAKGILEDMAKLSAATGTNFADMGNTAAEVYNQLQDGAKTMEVMRALAGQGMAGAIDIKDLGQYGGRLSSSAAQFTGSLSGNIESFGAIAQLAKKLGGATDTAEATESVARLSSDFTKHELGFQDLGVNVYANKEKTKFRNAEDIITETVVKSKGDLGKLGDLFGERTIKAAKGAQVAYANAGGGEAGEAAIRSQFSELKSNTPTTEQVDAGAKARLAETQAQLNIAMEKLTSTVNNQLMPVLPQFIEQVVRLIPELKKFLEFITSLTPWQGIGLIVGAAIAKDIAIAGVGTLVSSAIGKVAKGVLASDVLSAAPGAGAAAVAAESATGVGAAGAGVAGAGATAASGGGLMAGLAGGAAAIGAVGAGVFGMMYGIGAIANSRAKSKIQGVLAEGDATPEQRQKKLDDVQALIQMSEQRDAVNRKYRNASGSLVNTDKMSPDEAKALGSETALQASNNIAKLKDTAEQLTQTLQKMNETGKEFAAMDPSGGGTPADPNHPSRGGVQ